MRRRNILGASVALLLVACGAPAPAPLSGPALVFFYTEQ
jgi:hypothetical protein